MLNMGFQEDVETILAETPDDKQVALFSATIPPAIRRISKRYLTDAVEITVKTKTVTAAGTRQRYIEVSHGAEDGCAHPHSRGRDRRRDDRVRPDQASHRGSRRTAALARVQRGRDQRRPDPGAARTHHRPAAQRRPRHPRRHRRGRARPRRRAHQPRGQLRHPAGRRVLRPPHRTDGPGRAHRRRAAVRHPARAAPAQGDREGHPAADHRDVAADGRRRQRAPGRPSSPTRSPPAWVRPSSRSTAA